MIGRAHVRVSLMSVAVMISAAVVIIVGSALPPTPASAIVRAGVKTEIAGKPNGIAVLSVGVTNTQAGGYFQVLPCGETPGTYSTLNATYAGQTIANLAIVKLDAFGKACVYNESASDIFVDLQGYLSPSAFTPASQRLQDTRQPAPRPPVPAGGRTKFTGQPNGLAVVSIVATSSTSPGYFQALPCAAAPGAYSNLNVDRAGQTIANLAIVQLDANGESCIYTEGGAHTIVDLQGYLNPATFTVASQRLLDTRQPAPGSALPADGRAGMVGRANGLAVLSIIGAETRAPGYFQLLSCSAAAGAYSNLNSDRVGQTIANLALIQLDSDGSTCLYTQGGAHLITDVQGYFDPSVFTPVNKRILDTRQTPTPPTIPPTIPPTTPPTQIPPTSFQAIYAVPSDRAAVTGRADAIAHEVSVVQAWYDTQTGGRHPIFQRAGSSVEVLTVALPQTFAAIRDDPSPEPEIEQSIRAVLPSSKANVQLVVILEGQNGSYCGRFGSIVLIPVGNCLILPTVSSTWPYGMSYLLGHELTHALGAVPACAPHASNYHVNDDPRDILYEGPMRRDWPNLALDPGNDDYFRHANPSCTDIDDSLLLGSG